MDVLGTSGVNAQLPSCAFNKPADPWNTEPELSILYLSNWPNRPVYKLVTCSYDSQQDQWNFSSPPSTIAGGSTTYAARPAIVFAENNDRWIAYISSDNEVKAQKNGDTAQYASSQTDLINHSWVSLAIDSVSFDGGYLPQIVCTGKFFQVNWDIYYIQYDN
jgi:hypothetical protein